MGTSHHHHPWPLPRSPGLQVQSHSRGCVPAPSAPCAAGVRPQRMSQCLAPSQPGRAVGSARVSGVHSGPQPCGRPRTGDQTGVGS